MEKTFWPLSVISCYLCVTDSACLIFLKFFSHSSTNTGTRRHVGTSSLCWSCMRGRSNTMPQPSAPLTARFCLRSSSNLTSSHLLSVPWRPPSPSVASPAVTCSVSICRSVLNVILLPARARFHAENRAKCSLLTKVLPGGCPGLPGSSELSTKRIFMLSVKKCCQKWPF